VRAFRLAHPFPAMLSFPAQLLAGGNRWIWPVALITNRRLGGSAGWPLGPLALQAGLRRYSAMGA